METIEIRPIQTSFEREVCLDLWATVFPEDRAFFQERLDYDPAYAEETTWIAKVDETIAAAVQIFPYYTSLDGVLIKVGGIGSVATLPEYRGKSLTQLILRHQSDWMRRNGFDLSLLFTGINSFYEKAGWDTLSQYSYTLGVERGLSVISSRLSSTAAYTIKPYDPVYLDQIMAIYESFTKDYFGPALRTEAYWLGQLKWLKEGVGDFLVALDNDRVIAYLRVKKGREAVLEVTECGYTAGYETACLSLIKEALYKAPEYKQFKASVPTSHALYSLLLKDEAVPEEETYEMWKVVNLPALLSKLRGVFTHRLQETTVEDVTFPLLINSGNEDAILHLQNGFLDVEQPMDVLKYQKFYKRKPSELLSDLIKGSLTDDLTIKALFPKKDYLFWCTDSF